MKFSEDDRYGLGHWLIPVDCRRPAVNS
jgi:hypothetical protein